MRLVWTLTILVLLIPDTLGLSVHPTRVQPGESVLIIVGDNALAESLDVNTATNTFTYLGVPSGNFSFNPMIAGNYTVVLKDGSGLVIESVSFEAVASIANVTPEPEKEPSTVLHLSPASCQTENVPCEAENLTFADSVFEYHGELTQDSGGDNFVFVNLSRANVSMNTTILEANLTWKKYQDTSEGTLQVSYLNDTSWIPLCTKSFMASDEQAPDTLQCRVNSLPTIAQLQDGLSLRGDFYYSGSESSKVFASDFIVLDVQFTNESSANQEIVPASGPGANLTDGPLADLIITSNNITFSTSSPHETELVTVFATIFNRGGTDTGEFISQFFLGDPLGAGVQLGANQTVSGLVQGQNITLNVSFVANMGPYNLFVRVDAADNVSENVETDNSANRTVSVPGYQIFYGNLTQNITLENSANMSLYIMRQSSLTTGNIYFVDSEENIAWASLKALGRNTSGFATTNDFTEVDSAFNMTTFQDNISTIWSLGGLARLESTLQIFGNPVLNVPMANSTNNTAFLTGILWDSSDDRSHDGEYSLSDHEDLVFVARASPQAQGAYGRYDYEARVPARLRSYNSTAETISIYVELQ